jgi:hypothetical protein
MLQAALYVLPLVLIFGVTLAANPPLSPSFYPHSLFVRLPLFLGFGAGISIRRHSHLTFSKNPRPETSTC